MIYLKAHYLTRTRFWLNNWNLFVIAYLLLMKAIICCLMPVSFINRFFNSVRNMHEIPICEFLCFCLRINIFIHVIHFWAVSNLSFDTQKNKQNKTNKQKGSIFTSMQNAKYYICFIISTFNHTTGIKGIKCLAIKL